MNRSEKDPLQTNSYDFHLPQNLIATHPLSPAHNAKLLIYKKQTNQIIHTTFKNLLDYIPQNTSIFLNDTKVIKARIFGIKQETKGKIELLLNKPMPNNTYLCYIKGKVKQNTILQFDHNLFAKVLNLYNDGSRLVQFDQQNKILDFPTLIDLLEQIGHIPLPPYINREDTKADEINYQSLFAKNYGAVAAPTASLHFTKELLQKMQENFPTNYITLHIGAGTFKPVQTQNILSHKMHSEYYNISTQTQKAINTASNILAIGTTVTRTLEYYARTKNPNSKCDLFLNPTNKPQLVNNLLTNFHLPKSTLIMLVASFIGIEKTLELYNIAIKNNYRFYSYGDAMLIIGKSFWK